MVQKLLDYWANADDTAMYQILENAPIMLHSVDASGHILQVSNFWASQLGYSPDEMLGMRSTEFLTPESAREAREENIPRFFKTGKVHNVAYDFVRKDGSPLPVLMSAVAILDNHGNFLRTLAVMFDNSEAQLIKAELVQSQRTDAIGKLVGGVAHDFNNLLTVIQGNIEFLKFNINDPDRDQFLNDAYDAVKRGAALTHQLLAYGRKARIVAEPLNCNEVVRDISTMVQRLLPAMITLETRCAPDLWMAEVDRHMFGTALLNLINNARDAMPGHDGQLAIETSNQVLSQAQCSDGTLEPGPYVVVSVHDNGTGMPDTVASKVFEPFFTTKEAGKGSGLGLSMVYGFVTQSNGTVRITSEPDHGTSVNIFFPALDVCEGVDPLDPDGEHEARPSHPDVLVVEDEDQVRNVLMRQLKGLNLRLASAATGDAALAMIETGLQPRLLLTDVVMPGDIQGPELARRACDIIPTLEVVFVSGYQADAPVVSDGLRAEDTHFVKPADTNELLEVVREKLARSNLAGSGTKALPARIKRRFSQYARAVRASQQHHFNLLACGYTADERQRQ